MGHWYSAERELAGSDAGIGMREDGSSLHLETPISDLPGGELFASISPFSMLVLAVLPESEGSETRPYLRVVALPFVIIPESVESEFIEGSLVLKLEKATEAVVAMTA